MGISHGSPRSDLQMTTPSDNTIVLTRTFKAPRRMVWEAMTSPDKMKRWMLPPPGWTLSVCDCDARVAGALRLVWKNEQGDQSLSLNGVFSEVARQERMVHTELMLMGADQVIGSQVETHELVSRDHDEDYAGVCVERGAGWCAGVGDGGWDGGGVFGVGCGACTRFLNDFTAV